MRSQNSRVCGALEAAYIFLRIPLYGKNKNAAIMYVNVYKSRQRNEKSYQKVQEFYEKCYRTIRIIARGRPIFCTAQRARERLPIRFRQEIRTAKYEVETLASDLAQNSKNEADLEKKYKADEMNKIEAAGAMVEFRDALANEKEDLAVVAHLMNTDQKRVFDRVLKSWVKENLKKELAVCTPTGIAAFNINGLSLHRLLQLPIKHGGVQGYKSINDDFW
ncbi:hypothetical protein JTE90_000815 [Oedothorax gibbosus]|uniref:Uncharacterized protein n=1 Tax=Oedothorax gibbosus TaxID=931172 RepID=A0AAV6TLX8_9ARAC|nr:hypothetical protein JTE90_000815 [Oedothorax gibbosus]